MMPLYTYRCSCGAEFDRIAGIDDDIKLCTCYRLAHRVEVNSVVVKAGGVTVPDTEPEYQNDQDKQNLKRRGWDGDRAVEHIRKHMKEGADGVRYLDAPAANSASLE